LEKRNFNILKDKLEEYQQQNNPVQIAVAHRFRDDKLFYHHGKVISVDDTGVILNNGNGLTQIRLNEIIEIRPDRRGY
jgi:hypothetical protein